MLKFNLLAVLIGWFAFTMGFCLIGTQFDTAKRLKKQLWNGRIDKLGKPPFSVFLESYENKSYFGVWPFLKEEHVDTADMRLYGVFFVLFV